MLAKKFSFKGLELEALEKITVEDFIKLMPSKARRSMRRMGLQVKKFLEKFREWKKSGDKKPFKTHCRQMPVLPEMIGSRVQVHNGKDFVDFTIAPEMLGHRLGEYSITIKQVRHSGPGIGATRGSKSVELK